ncbi:hypothetical protein [Micromonospora craniellae]|uniref:Uncharacterized protein n=1 Tax=Micromonospora craniellae TaxID=2294034 RepID=A0A372FXU1_9ACTN|nr:hypothetical protein [Micromonospora craniellae]RFS45553.1 hypothetical protein D0Q02_15730 [Micromonospora craniellae]
MINMIVAHSYKPLRGEAHSREVRQCRPENHRERLLGVPENIGACTISDMTSDTRENALPKDTQEDLAELDFAPITNEEAFKVEDRTYLFGVHVDGVRG